MSEILRQDIDIDGILLALTKDEIPKLFPFKIMPLSFMIQQILTPWWWRKIVNLTWYKVIKGKSNRLTLIMHTQITKSKIKNEIFCNRS